MFAEDPRVLTPHERKAAGPRNPCVDLRYKNQYLQLFTSAPFGAVFSIHASICGMKR